MSQKPKKSPFDSHRYFKQLNGSIYLDFAVVKNNCFRDKQIGIGRKILTTYRKSVITEIYLPKVVI